jgi:hypothetical protein
MYDGSRNAAVNRRLRPFRSELANLNLTYPSSWEVYSTSSNLQATLQFQVVQISRHERKVGCQRGPKIHYRIVTLAVYHAAYSLSRTGLGFSPVLRVLKFALTFDEFWPDLCTQGAIRH